MFLPARLHVVALPLGASLLLVLLGGCRTPASLPASVTNSGGATEGGRAPISSMPLSPLQRAIADVQSRPLYQQAQTACRTHAPTQAVQLLTQLLKQPGLSAEAVEFVHQQRNLCLKDAGLPVPAVKPSLASVAVAAPRPRVLTAEEADCGPRALRLACADMGMQTELAALRQAAGTSGQGTSLAGLSRAAKKLGLKGEGVQVSREALGEVPLPAVAYVNGSHFIAVLKLEGKGEDMVATVHDPNSPQTARLTREQLLRACSGYLLLLR